MIVYIVCHSNRAPVKYTQTHTHTGKTDLEPQKQILVSSRAL